VPTAGDPEQVQETPPPPRVGTSTELTVDLAWQSVVSLGLAVVALVVLWGAVRSASTVFTLIVVALFVALALDPLVVAVGRRASIGRGWSTVAVLGVVLVLVGLFLGVAAPQLVKESANLERQLPDTVDSLEQLPLAGRWVREAGLSDKVSEAIASLPTRVEQAGASVGSLVTRVGFGVGAMVLSFLLVAGALFEGPGLIADLRRASPPSRRAELDGIGRTVYAVLAKYFAGSLLVAVANGIWVATVALVAGVPLSPVLGVWSALTALIPQIGGLMGFALVAVVSLTAGVVPMLVMSVAFLAFMLFSNHVLVPTVVGRAVSLSAPVTMLAAIGGFSVGGIVGALFAVPTFGAIKAVVLRVRSGQLSAPPEPPEPDAGSLAKLRSWWHRRRHHEGPAAAATGPGSAADAD
jgi:predicted PurR-regulated permease PerM